MLIKLDAFIFDFEPTIIYTVPPVTAELLMKIEQLIFNVELEVANKAPPTFSVTRLLLKFEELMLIIVFDAVNTAPPLNLATFSVRREALMLTAEFVRAIIAPPLEPELP